MRAIAGRAKDTRSIQKGSTSATQRLSRRFSAAMRTAMAMSTCSSTMPAWSYPTIPSSEGPRHEQAKPRTPVRYEPPLASITTLHVSGLDTCVRGAVQRPVLGALHAISFNVSSGPFRADLGWINSGAIRKICGAVGGSLISSRAFAIIASKFCLTMITGKGRKEAKGS